MEALKEVDLDAISGEDLGCNACEDIAIVTAVMTDSYRNLGERSEGLLKVVRQTLRSCTDGVAIHTVGAYAHDAT